MSRWMKFLIGALLITLLAYGTFYWKRDGIITDLNSRGNAALAAQGFGWAKVEFRPDPDKPYQRIGYLSGGAPSPEEAERARDAVLAAIGGGGFGDGAHDVRMLEGAGGVSTLNAEWRAELKNGELLLTGQVPRDADRAEIAAYATTRWPGIPIINKMTLEPNLATEGWVATTKVALDYMTNLQDPSAVLSTASGLTVSGKTGNADLASRLIADLPKTMPGTIQGRALVETSGTAAPAAPAPAATAAAPAHPCQAKVDAVMANATINFASGKADLVDNPNAILDALAVVASDCPDTKIEVGGHTDKHGSDKDNQRLSQARAQTVVSYLTGKGVAADRLTATGYGESRLKDTADTPEADAANRRIEFTVTGAPSN
jgi:outer membrane protein OmpA-like peptidoglycan-associated protein